MRPVGALAVFALAASVVGCNDEDERSLAREVPSSTATPGPPASAPFDAPRLLFLPDAGDVAPPEAPFRELVPPRSTFSRCPPDMVEVDHRYCVDRYEVSLLDTRGARPVSPYYYPDWQFVRDNHARWLTRAVRSKTALGRELQVPSPPDWELSGPFEVRAVSQRGVLPNGYLSAKVAAKACANAGKRLCTHEEWVQACRGERGDKFPYGSRYQAGQCNVCREAHPAALLHGNASIHHLDPRLNLTTEHGRALLRRTGETSSCASVWGQDAIYDMVGNLDEWVADEDGMFVGGFFSRATKEGCDAAITTHPAQYYDYSLGTRCCLSID